MAEEVLKMKINRPYIGKVYPFEKLVKALRYFQSGKTIGKIVVKVD